MEQFQVSLASWVIITHNSNVLTLIVSERGLGLESLPGRGRAAVNNGPLPVSATFPVAAEEELDCLLVRRAM